MKSVIVVDSIRFQVPITQLPISGVGRRGGGGERRRPVVVEDGVEGAEAHGQDGRGLVVRAVHAALCRQDAELGFVAWAARLLILV